MQKNVLSILIVFMLASFKASSQATKIQVLKGQKFMVETTNKTTSSAEVMGQTMENNIDSKNTTVYEITNGNGDGYDLQVTITKIQLNATSMGQQMTFDSDKKDNEGPVTDALSGVVNKPKAVTIDAKGNITKQEAEESNMNMMMGGGMSGSQTTTELFIPAFIGKELKSGDSFTATSSVSKDKMSSKDSGTYTITKIEDGVATASYAGTQVVTATMEQMGMEMTTNSNNIVKSELMVDLKTGLVLMKAMVTESTVSVDAGGMTIPATGKTIITTKITPVQ